MKKMRLFLICSAFVISLALNQPASAQFENRDDVWRTYGPGESKVSIGSLYTDPKKPTFVFAESNGALYRSSDARLAWAPAATPRQANVVRCWGRRDASFVGV
ncbi:MAG: hypothetical protein ONB48_21705 [candidate division KSB1 bacterium]|nr:hypothetical protein [candidate division KSB1 bacterium]MDZ7276655.1 hypothetical protein [candidate division KSB1 bacterium]MDZ7288265.1 hypothetical protein [candidate division KSB1 bacterium]MDZ7300473.1 hypothetical protein [candidate division KSB1 bacterium]MDZ7351472.1 hypothetical protein [candidate division KSB1 bacterium]